MRKGRTTRWTECVWMEDAGELEEDGVHDFLFSQTKQASPQQQRKPSDTRSPCPASPLHLPDPVTQQAFLPAAGQKPRGKTDPSLPLRALGHKKKKKK